MKIIAIAFTASTVTDMKRARRFDEDVLGLTPVCRGGAISDPEGNTRLLHKRK